MVRAAISAFPKTCGKRRPGGQRQQSRPPSECAAEPELDEILTTSAALPSKDVLQPCARRVNVKWNGCFTQLVPLLHLSCTVFVFSLLGFSATETHGFESLLPHAALGSAPWEEGDWQFCNLPWLHCRVMAQLYGLLNIYRPASLRRCKVVVFCGPGAYCAPCCITAPHPQEEEGHLLRLSRSSSWSL